MNDRERKSVDSGDLEIADMRGELKVILARFDGMAALFHAEIGGVKSQISALDDRFCEVKASTEDACKLLRDDSRRHDDRLRVLEGRPPSSRAGSAKLKRALIAIAVWLASALSGAGAGKLAAGSSSDHQVEAKR